MATKNEVVKITKTSAVMTLDTIGTVTMPADTGRNVKAILGAMEVGNKANLTMCKSLARIKATESYKEVYNADGENVSPTFGDFAESVLNMSKGGASNYASVGELFGNSFESEGWKYGHYVLMLKLRKILDENGEPLDGAGIIAMLEEHGATPDMSTRKLDELIKNLLCAGDSEDEEDEEDGEGTEDGEDTEDGEEENNTVSLTTAFKVIRASAEKSGKWDKLQKRIIDLEKELEG